MVTLDGSIQSLRGSGPIKLRFYGRRVAC